MALHFAECIPRLEPIYNKLIKVLGQKVDQGLNFFLEIVVSLLCMHSDQI